MVGMTRSNEQDSIMVEKVLTGQQGAFEALILHHQQLVWHIVYRMVDNPDDCKELSQEVFLRVYNNLKKFRFESKLATWIGRIAFNIAARHLQRKSLPLFEPNDDKEICITDTIASDIDIAAAFVNEDLIKNLHAALQSLAAAPRTILTLYYLDELSISEVTEILDKPAGTVKNALFRARVKLREKLEYYLEVTNEK